jgi:hypothetical protein
MPATRSLAVVVASLLAAVVAGCGLGEGEADPGTATLTVTRDHGAEALLEATVEDPTASDTVARLLDREAEVETSYGGNFIDSIDGIEGGVSGSRRRDWFFYVNGYWSPVGAAEASVRAGDRIWWDYRDWTDAYRVSAVVGSWPEPFLHGGLRAGGGTGSTPPTELVCFDAEAACKQAVGRLREVGADVRELGSGERRGDPAETLSVLVGSWEEVRSDPVAAELERGPATSGVYARPRRCDGTWSLEVLDERAEPVAVRSDAGWVAALGDGERQPTWVVSGGGPEGVAAAAEALDQEALADRYAIATTGDAVQALPADEVSLSEPKGAVAGEEGRCP